MKTTVVLFLMASIVHYATGFPSIWVVGSRQHRINASSIAIRGPNMRLNKMFIELRGGGGGGVEDSLTGTSEQENPNDSITREERYRQSGMSVALSSGYFAVMGAKCALPSVLSLLTSPKGGMTFSPHTTPQAQMANLLGLSTVAVAMGKLLLGPAIDHFGGIQSLQVCLACLAGLLAYISSIQQFHHFALAWILVDFIFSACWAASINSIHQSFQEKDWGKQIGYLAMGARTGNAVAFSMFATILYVLAETTRQPWRKIFFASALLQAVPLALITYFGRKTLRETDPLSKKKDNIQPATVNPVRILIKEARSAPEFWLHLLSRSCLMVFASFLLFVPTLMSQVYGMSPSFAAQVASIYSVGCLFSVSLGSRIYSLLPKKKQIFAIVTLLGLATLSSLVQLGHVMGAFPISSTASAMSMFVWGFAFSIPFYLPPSLYALERGGKAGSATISDAFDFLGFALLAIFNGYVASIAHKDVSAWIGCFQITTLCSFLSLIAQPLAVFLQQRPR
ncbi:major facilitator superfamily transporter [Nitzschia inconspicua]|uniref:Major facilitator superfamily transporter n=1 Tax=Nitzschia inconspicua TaxID=303405 RepID=A0A9K3PPB2_9STRA|nr:major facilitator superfamily transporter [Nitzschia inconspicua]